MATGIRISNPSTQRLTLLQGLCRSCLYAPACAYLADDAHGVWQCSEYEGAVDDSAEGASMVPLVISKAAVVKQEIKGLCVDCGNHGDCVYPRPDGGVWRCEEYK